MRKKVPQILRTDAQRYAYDIDDNTELLPGFLLARDGDQHQALERLIVASVKLEKQFEFNLKVPYFALKNSKAESAIYLAAEKGYYHSLDRLRNASSHYPKTLDTIPIRYKIEQKVVETLSERNQTTNMTPLMAAVVNGHYKCVERLLKSGHWLEQGADIAYFLTFPDNQVMDGGRVKDELFEKPRGAMQTRILYPDREDKKGDKTSVKIRDLIRDWFKHSALDTETGEEVDLSPPTRIVTGWRKRVAPDHEKDALTPCRITENELMYVYLHERSWSEQEKARKASKEEKTAAKAAESSR